ncbi:MAG: ABC transporter permease [Prosthecobacter sp.]|jgi:oligopeptide transport system permease protein|uniref:ABC transporter permease n=1 Tax=Prosthecobacter sp. TaxID=1965333 RepID=UPI0019E0B715|nr:ABC transporter permease [Prosthecobacter sp.]MBE2283928.1 ABC transporter permease [Prosthecobacter sp.]
MPDAAAPARIPRPDGWQILKRNRAAMFALRFLVVLACVAIVVPMLLPAALKVTSSESFMPPSARHLLGSDVNGQDMLYRVLSGARVSLGVGFMGAVISLFIGTLYGMISGYAGGRVDAFMMRTVEVLQSVPRILFIMILIAALDDYVKEWVDGWRLAAQAENWNHAASLMSDLQAYSKVLVMIVSLGLVEWLVMARIVRGQVLVLRELTFVTASKAMGQGSWGVLRRHLLPNLSTIILTYLTLTIPAVILDESFLSFLGLGIEDPAASWGSLLKDGAQVINPLESKWWLLVFPALLMAASLLALNFLGDGLRDAFDPKSGE